MTIRQVAEITGKSEDTIIRSVRKLCPQIEIKHGVPIDLPELEAFRVLKDHESDFHIEVPQNSGVVTQDAGIKKHLLSGALVRPMESMYGKTEGAKRVDFLLGFPGIPGQLSQRNELALKIGLRVLDKQERDKRQLRLELPGRKSS